MAAVTVTFRVYRDTPGFGVKSSWSNQIGPDFVVAFDDAAVLPAVRLIAVDSAPAGGSTYTVTGQTDGTDVGYGDTSSIVILAVGS